MPIINEVVILLDLNSEWYIKSVCVVEDNVKIGSLFIFLVVMIISDDTLFPFFFNIQSILIFLFFQILFSLFVHICVVFFRTIELI